MSGSGLHAGGHSSSPGRSAVNGQEEDEEDLDDEVDASRLERFMRERRRARSLPLLDSGRKRVKFADSMGLDLASVKHFSSLEEPQVPNKVLSRYRSFPPPQQELLGGPWQSLRSVADTDRRLLRLRVCLEKVSVSQWDVRGHIRVLCGRSGGVVGVRYTFNHWLSHVDAQATAVPAEEPGLLGQRFCFAVYMPPFVEPGAPVQLAVYVRSEDGDFWDNNEGQNYTLGSRCMPGNSPSVSAAFCAT